MRIVTPIMPRNVEEIKALDSEHLAEADLIEWRADYLAKDAIVALAPMVFEKCQGKEVIFTIRTSREGGQLEIAAQDYVDVIKEIASRHEPTYIDFEYYSYSSVYQQISHFPNLVLSYHNFDETPENYRDLMSGLVQLSPAVVKMAVIPQTEQDVLDVMSYTRHFKDQYQDQIFATIAMGELGKLTRIAGRISGSSWTFASLDESSAPGQLSVAVTRQFLENLERKQ
ncbi:3-dehydroquinate dehydratase [Streptococcus agalactiae LMG 14747]|uniref:3-dehydroquinate dehydratase n=1 Tax=Streptococcus agalactiae LMG 14747 TaxID=1154860 RepID=V6YYY4_STRAG|nr:3-dehydroquinate dehydratase [Streptococcus agalactiae LMG 14747]